MRHFQGLSSDMEEVVCKHISVTSICYTNRNIVRNFAIVSLLQRCVINTWRQFPFDFSDMPHTMIDWSLNVHWTNQRRECGTIILSPQSSFYTSDVIEWTAELNKQVNLSRVYWLNINSFQFSLSLVNGTKFTKISGEVSFRYFVF